ncbi:transporter [Wenyingzhuangia sp. IMCC45467]
MNRILLCIFCFILFTSTNYAQYTTIINANRPGDTETPYAVGRNVFQIENSILLNSTNNKSIHRNMNTFSNNLDLHYGFWSERLEATLNHQFSHGEINNHDITGTENLSIGLKYLIYEHVNKESPELKKSWKRRYGFKYNGLIPSVAIALKYNTPLANSQFYNGGLNSFTMSIITQNNISKKVRLNNQLDYYNHGGNYAQMVYSVSSSYVIAKRWNPYLQAQLYGSNDYHYTTIGVGTPFLVNKNLALAFHYKTSVGKNISGHEIGLNLAFRIDNHYDRWEYIEEPKKEKKSKIEKEEEIIEKDEFIDTLLEEPIKKEEKPKKEKKEKVKKKKKKKKKKVKKEPIEDVILSY